MTAVWRYDGAELRLDTAKRLDNGWLRVDAAIGKVGVLEYRNADGSVRREYRPPEEVFATDALESFEMVPVTNEHPPVRLDATNTRTFAVGHVGNTLRREGDLIVAPLLITDARAIEEIQSGKRQLSPGYLVEYDATPGEGPHGRYDGVQRRIRGNHVAHLHLGRQGSEVALRMDSGDAVAVGLTPKGQPMKVKIRLDDGSEHEVPEAVAKAWEAAGLGKREDTQEPAQAGSGIVRGEPEGEPAKGREDGAGEPSTPAQPPKTEPRVDDGELAKLKAENDVLKSRLDKLEKADQDPSRLDARVDLLATAKSVVDGYSPRFDDGSPKSDVEVMADVVLALDPSAADALKANRSDAGYIRARYDMALAERAKGQQHGKRLLDIAASASRKDAGEPSEVEKVIQERQDEYASAWQRKDLQQNDILSVLHGAIASKGA